MPEKLHRCVNDVKGQGKSEDSAWAICNDSLKECEVCGDLEHEPNDHPYIPRMAENVLSIAGISEMDNPLHIAGVEETHNPLDIPFGREVPTKEVNNNIKSEGGMNDVDEGGLGSGRQPEGGNDLGGGQQGPLISFGETIVKELMDAKLKESCPCHKNN